MAMSFAVLGRIANAVFGAFVRFFRYRTWYRRAIGKSVWHSSSKCAGWPTHDFEERATRASASAPNVCGLNTGICAFAAQPVEIDDAGLI